MNHWPNVKYGELKWCGWGQGARQQVEPGEGLPQMESEHHYSSKVKFPIK